MAKIINNCRRWLAGCVPNLVLLMALAVPGASIAGLLDVQLKHPLLVYNSGGTTSYAASTGAFSVAATPLFFQILPNTQPFSITGSKSFTIDIVLDSTGGLIGGIAGDDLVVRGEITVGSDTYSGVLLTGEVSTFGFQESGATDSFDFTFTVTGGALHGSGGAYDSAVLIGVKLDSEAISGLPSFENFETDFTAGAKGTLGALTASLGDRAWEDLNANGIQDCTDTNGNGILGDVDPMDPNDPNKSDQGAECGAGIEGVTVRLFHIQTDPNTGAESCGGIQVGGDMLTDSQGFYLFAGLVPAEDYCVQFGQTQDDFCETELDGVSYPLGAADFTTQSMVIGEENDSDADEVDGTTSGVDLGAGEINRSIDAGYVCPAKIGDFVWYDLDMNGIQDAGETGVGNVTVKLFECGLDGVPGNGDDVDTGESRVTAADGMYMFGAEPGVYDLPTGNYYVQFDESTLPTGYEFTKYKQGSDDTIDSDCNADMGGRTACTDLSSSRSINLNRDCGIEAVSQRMCEIGIEKTCRIESPPMTGEKCKGKLQQFTLVWDGDNSTIDGVNMGTFNINGGVFGTTGNINNGDTVIFKGPYSSNDVLVDISGTETGQSKFHVSCSDGDFNSADDCGKLAGNGKDNNSGLLNSWKLQGFIDGNGDVLDCNSDDNTGGGFSNSCEFVKPAPTMCDKNNKPKSLTFEYTGGNCPGDNDQGSKTSCDGTLNNTMNAMVSVDGGEGYTVLPDMVAPGETFTITRSGSDFKSSTVIDLTNDGTQTNDVHTSCSAPLAVGDVFGAITLTKINGQTGGSTDVTYQYVVTAGGDNLTDIVVTDDQFDDPVGTIPSLLAGESETFLLMTGIDGTTINIATATANGSGTDACSAQDTVVVTEVPPPPCEIIGDSKLKLKKKKLEWKIQNLGTAPAVIDRIEIIWPQATNGDLKKVKIGKKEIVKDNYPGPSADIMTFKGSASDRTIKLGKAKTIKFEFEHNVSKNIGDYGLLKIHFEEGCEVVFDPADIPDRAFNCKDAKPIDSLSMIWGGPSGVDVTSPKGDVETNVQNGEEVTFSGLSGLGNDVFWGIEGAGLSGSSRFHVSCSDGEMNGPEDCGNAAGDGKDNNSSNLNLWLFEGMEGTNGIGLDCSAL